MEGRRVEEVIRILAILKRDVRKGRDVRAAVASQCVALGYVESDPRQRVRTAAKILRELSAEEPAKFLAEGVGELTEASGNLELWLTEHIAQWRSQPPIGNVLDQAVCSLRADGPQRVAPEPL